MSVFSRVFAKESQEKERPIIFIGHSIGGLLIKKVKPPSTQLDCGTLGLTFPRLSQSQNGKKIIT
jgi:hypothetical protein